MPWKACPGCWFSRQASSWPCCSACCSSATGCAMHSTRRIDKMSQEKQNDTLLELKDYSITFETPEGQVKAVSNMNLTVRRGERIAIVGESGSGKSQTFLGIMGLLAKNGKTTGQALLEGKNVLALKPRELDR